MFDSNNNRVGETQFSSDSWFPNPLHLQSLFKLLPAALALLPSSQDVQNGPGMLPAYLGKLLPFPDGS